MANVVIHGKPYNPGEVIGLVEKNIRRIDTCSTIVELNTLLADIKIGIDCLSKATIAESVCRSAIQVLIDSLKSELTDATKKVEKKLNALLTAEAKVDIAQLLAQAKKWLSYGYKDVASSYLRTYERLRAKFGIDADPDYESVKLAACS